MGLLCSMQHLQSPHPVFRGVSTQTFMSRIRLIIKQFDSLLIHSERYSLLVHDRYLTRGQPMLQAYGSKQVVNPFAASPRSWGDELRPWGETDGHDHRDL